MDLILCDDFNSDECCSSCHWDDENGYPSMMEVDGFERSLVCCGVMRWIDSHPAEVQIIRERAAKKDQPDAD